jgi:hypothetical protein
VIDTALIRRAAALLAVAALLGSLFGVAGCAGTEADLPEPEDLPAQTREVSVYFSTGRTLIEEPRVVDSVNVYEAALAELMAAEPENRDVALVQPVAQIRSVTFEGGLVTVDCDRAVLDFEAEPGEYQLAWAAVLLTLGQFEEVERMAFTVEGESAGTIDGKDIAEFWGEVTLKDQPWDVTRPPGFGESEEDTSTT